MQVIDSIENWRKLRQNLSPDLLLGFVPTMGNLHAGHVSLYKIARTENDLSIASIFINPQQFDQVDDYAAYPRTLAADLEILAEAAVDYCLLPTATEIYIDAYTYQVHENSYSLLMEGACRAGHFTGVLTIVMKLLQLIKAHNAYFGEKDYQQLKLIQAMAEAFFIDTKINSCPIVREASGLAYSSRNNRLNSAERLLADSFAALFHQTHLDKVQLQIQLSALGITVEYLEEHAGRRFVAIKIGNVRLIDNYPLD